MLRTIHRESLRPGLNACKCGNEPTDSIKCGEFLDYLRTGYLLKKVSAPWTTSVKYKMKRFVRRGSHSNVTLQHWSNPSFLCAFAKLRKAIISFISVCLSACNNSAHTKRSFMKFYIWIYFEKLSRKCKFRQNLTRILGILREDLCTYVTVCRWILRTEVFAD